MIKTKIIIKDLKILTHIGVSEEERSKLQEIIISITLEIDSSQAIVSDNVLDSVNYKTIYTEILKLIKESNYHLLERLGKEIMVYCLSVEKVNLVRIILTKPKRLPNSNGVSIEMELQK